MLEFHNENCTCNFQSKIKSATIKEEPWRHLIVDDIYCQSCFQKISELLTVKKIKSDFEAVDTDHSFSQKRQNRLDDANHKKMEDIIKLRSDKHVRQFLDCAEYIYSLYPNYRKYDSIYCLPSISRMAPGVIWPVHDDSIEKSITMVIYIDPEENHGTTLYSSETEFHHRVEWKPNRAHIFCPETNVTWHGYGADGDNPLTRTTIVWFVQENPLHNKEGKLKKNQPKNDEKYWKMVFDYITQSKCIKNFN